MNQKRRWDHVKSGYSLPIFVFCFLDSAAFGWFSSFNLYALWTESYYFFRLLGSVGLPWWLSSKESVCNAGGSGSIPGLGRFPREGNGNPLQYSCQENPMDRGAWRATVPGVAKSWTQLKRLNTQAQQNHSWSFWKEVISFLWIPFATFAPFLSRPVPCFLSEHISCLSSVCCRLLEGKVRLSYPLSGAQQTTQGHLIVLVLSF